MSDEPNAPPELDPRLRVLQLSDELAALHRRAGVQSGSAEISRGQSLVSLARSVLSRARALRSRVPRPVEAPPSAGPGWTVDDPLDTRHAHSVAGLDRVAHVFHAEWKGVRAAAGYLPGAKVCLSAERPLTVEDVRALGELLLRRRWSAVLFQGWSPNAALLARAWRRIAGRDVRLLAVWHGNTSQFMNPYEVTQVASMLELRREGTLDRLGGVKPGVSRLDSAFHRELLLNVPPALVERRQPDASNTGLLPVPNDWRKNYWTNLFAANDSRLNRLLVTTPLPRPFPFSLRTEVIEAAAPGRAEFFALLRRANVMLNVSLSECQPMTALEGLAHGVPTLTGPLTLGALDRHPFQRLMQVAEVDAIEPISNRLEAVLSLAWSESASMMADYEARLVEQALERLGEFVS